MKTVVEQINGNWDVGYTLDKHMQSSTYLGDDEHGHPRFDNHRTEVGEAIYQLKNQQKSAEAARLAKAIFDNIIPRLIGVQAIIPMAASTARTVQPVNEIAAELSGLTGLPWYKDWLVKEPGGRKLKDIAEEDRASAVKGSMSLRGELNEPGKTNVLLLDDLYQSGASVNEACAVLRKNAKIGKIYLVALTRKR